MSVVLGRAAAFVSIIVMGYLLKRAGFFHAEDFHLLSKIMVRITLPCAIVYNFSSLTIDNSLLVMCLIGIGCNLLLVGIGFFVNLRNSGADKGFDMLNVSGYNIGNFTLPFVQNFLGPMGFAVTSLFDSGNAVMCTGLTYSMAAAVAGSDERTSFKKMAATLFSSIPFDCYLIMTLLTICQIRLPSVLVNFAQTGGNANAFMAMLVIGVGFGLSADRRKLARIGKVLGIRLAVSVLLSLGCYWLSPFSLEVRQTLAIIMLGPVSSVSPAFTGKIHGDIELASVINSLSILMSIVSITVALVLIL